MLDTRAIKEGLKNNMPHKLIKRWWQYRIYFKKTYEIINEKEPHNFEIYTVAFNNERVIDYQIKFMKKNFKDPHLHIIVDNSSDNEISNRIKKICMDNDTMYIRLPKNSFYCSWSHATALNYLCKNIIPKRKDVKYFGFLDHDIFPIKKTSIIPYLKKQKMYGYLIDKEKSTYAKEARTIWPGFCFFDKSISKNFDFRPAKSLFPLYAIDTGGKNYKLIFKKYDKDRIEFSQKELICVKEDFNEFKSDYYNIGNYERSDDFCKKNKIIYIYEFIKNNERIHRRATYFNDNGPFSMEEYLKLLEHFYGKLDLLIS